MGLIIFVMTAIVMLISFLLLGLNIFFRNKSFPETSIGHNRHMKERGITCVKCDEIKNYRLLKEKTGIDPSGLKIISR